ncbi:hypothetical protein N7490_009184 [Penicillium lividum]|nr:hypothetical protein N7490_009184 [Penicillium lividum]
MMVELRLLTEVLISLALRITLTLSSILLWYFLILEACKYMIVNLDLLQPVSEGEVILNSSNSLVQPSINLNFFVNDLDLLAMCEGVRWA